MLKLKEIRLKRNLYQKDIANILGVSEATASRYENEVRMLDQNQIIKLSLALEVTPDELLGYKEAYENYSKYLQELAKEKEKH